MSQLAEDSRKLQSETAKKNAGKVGEDTAAAGMQHVKDKDLHDPDYSAETDKREAMSNVGDVQEGSREAGTQAGADKLANEKAR